MSACACADCEASCPGPINYPEEDEEFLINGLDGVIVIMLIVFFYYRRGYFNGFSLVSLFFKIRFK